MFQVQFEKKERHKEESPNPALKDHLNRVEAHPISQQHSCLLFNSIHNIQLSPSLPRSTICRSELVAEEAGRSELLTVSRSSFFFSFWVNLVSDVMDRLRWRVIPQNTEMNDKNETKNVHCPLIATLPYRTGIILLFR